MTLLEDGEEVVIAGARYMVNERVFGTRVAEVAFTVEEKYQGYGLASRLLAELAQIARAKAIVRFEADVLPGNKAMLKVFEKSGDVVKGFVTPQLSRFLPLHQLPFIVVGAHVAQV